MVDIEQLADEVLEFYSQRIKSNYRIGVVIVAPPGSGKSTIANQLRDILNTRYSKYLTEQSITSPALVGTRSENPMEIAKSLVSDLSEISKCQKEILNQNNGIFPERVEDFGFKPVKLTSDESITVIGRGGIFNSIKLSPPTADCNNGSENMAQVIPMDGFHLTRKCLDYFKDPTTAHKRRGSPSTFDSNNFLQLSKIIANTMAIKPPVTKIYSNIYSDISLTSRQDLPNIFVPGFDHSLKDPTCNQYCISTSTRIVILEGLYLFHNEENWKEVYPILEETKAIFPCDIEIDLEATELRVAKRHLESGLVDSLEAGRRKFSENDLLNAKLILEKKLDVVGVHKIRND